MSFLKHEGKTITNVKGLLNPSPLDMNTALINAISSLVGFYSTINFGEKKTYRLFDKWGWPVKITGNRIELQKI